MLFILLLFVTLAGLLPHVIPTPTVVRNDSPVTLLLSRKLNFTNNNAHTMYRRDLLRAQALRGWPLNHATPNEKRQEWNEGAVGFTSVENQAVSYVANVGIGDPMTMYSLIIDTGSANTWIGAGRSYVKTATSVSTGETISMRYGSGNFSGSEYLETVTLSPGLEIKNQTIAVAFSSQGFFGVDGVLGLGPSTLSKGCYSNHPQSLVPTILDNLLKEKVIPQQSIGISFAPMTTHFTWNGEISWGGENPYKMDGPLTYVPITNVAPSKNFWGIDSSISYGWFPNRVILSETAGIVDTGTTFFLLATDAFNQYKALTGATKDPATGLLTLSLLNFLVLQSLHCNIGGKNFQLTRNAQIWPRELNTGIGGSSHAIYLIVGDLGSKSGSGLDFVYGQAWLERFYMAIAPAVGGVKNVDSSYDVQGDEWEPYYLIAS